MLAPHQSPFILRHRLQSLAIYIFVTDLKYVSIYYTFLSAHTYVLEIDEEHTFGKGAVDATGVAAQKKNATGYPEWVMTKVRQSNLLVMYINADFFALQWNY